MAEPTVVPADVIAPLDMNGLSGRMLYLPAPPNKKRDILFVYGQHSNLERWWGLLQFANRYGAVTAPDLPGFGGMDSFYKIGKKPTIDNFADYLAAFVKMRYKHKKVTIVGMSLGFAIATRMLQRYPELIKHVQMLVSLGGLVHGDDFKFEPRRFRYYRFISWLFSFYVPAAMFHYLFLSDFVLRTFYHRTHLAKSKFAAASSPEEHKRFMDMEITLWQQEDPRTHAVTTTEMFKLDNCKKRIDLPVWQVNVAGDQYFDHHRVEQHLRVTFPTVHIMTAQVPYHAPSIIADEAAAAPMIPPRLRRALNKLS
ncbi:MAG TPA: alpha/beta hydrolase [Candidatus Saccharimonadales bacterium]|nr:alpha/beta hydrolase [Candidatus Saccharimonadales bacterium]